MQCTAKVFTDPECFPHCGTLQSQTFSRKWLPFSSIFFINLYLKSVECIYTFSACSETKLRRNTFCYYSDKSFWLIPNQLRTSVYLTFCSAQSIWVWKWKYHTNKMSFYYRESTWEAGWSYTQGNHRGHVTLEIRMARNSVSTKTFTSSRS